MTEHQHFTCCLPEDLFDRLRLTAADLDCSIDAVIDRALRPFLDQKDELTQRIMASSAETDDLSESYSDEQLTSFRRERSPQERAKIRFMNGLEGLSFQSFLPRELANWLRAEVAAGNFFDASHAAFVALQELRESYEFKDVRDLFDLRRAEKAIIGADVSRGITFEEMFAKWDSLDDELIAKFDALYPNASPCSHPFPKEEDE